MSESMPAAVLHGANDIRIEQRPLPELQPGMVMLRVRQVGICGSDLHYFEHGRCGAFVPSRPFILGHELTADVAARAADVETPKIGARVTVNPARACGCCEYCRAGRGNLCRRTIMLGSASTDPPTDGAFAGFVTVRSDQCHVLPPDIDDAAGAMMEPFAVALHAVKRAGSVSGKRVLITGGGPIGLLTLVTARAFGATPLVLSDMVAGRRHTALQLGADAVFNPQSDNLELRTHDLTGDGFDVVFEAAGAPAALRQAFGLVRPGGTIVQIGTLGADDVPLPANQLMVREVQLLGSFRYGNVFGEAIRLVEARRVNLGPFVSRVVPLDELPAGLQHALDREHVTKVQVSIR